MNTEEATLHYASCTPHRRGTRYHIVFEDFEDIGGDIYNAHTLRGFEVSTNQRIRYLRGCHGIPETHLPHEDDLWVSMPYRAMEALTLKSVSRSTCQRVLAEESIEDAPPSLLELGFIRRRFIARRMGSAGTRLATTIYKDGDGEFVVVDEVGDYIGIDGVKHSAPLQGFGLIERQYLYCIEQIKAAIAALDYLDAPEPQPRWEAVIERREPQKAKKSAATQVQRTAILSQASSDATTTQILRGTSHDTSELAMSFGLENNIANSALSREFDENTMRDEKPVERLSKQAEQFHSLTDIAALRYAPWTPETVIALSSLILAIPTRPNGSDEEALKRWLIDWHEPAQWLINATSDTDPRWAWTKIQRHVKGMTSGPTWHARQRQNPTPITLRHVVGYNKQTRQFTGHNWHSVEVALDREQWYPEEVIEYLGPPLEIAENYEVAEPSPVVAGQVVAITEMTSDQATESHEEQREPCTDELPTTDEEATVPAPLAKRQRLPGMTAQAVQALADEIIEKYPGLTIDYRPVAPERWVVKVHLNEKRRFDIDLVRWHMMAPETEQLIEQALLYAASLDGGGSSPPMEEQQQQRKGNSNERDEDSSDHHAGGISPAVFSEASG